MTPTTRFQARGARNRCSAVLCVLVILLLAFAAITFRSLLTEVSARPRGTPNTKNSSDGTLKLARLSQSVSVRIAGHSSPAINLSDGHEVLTAYAGPEDLQQAVAQNKAEALSLASADFDEDGVPDLISGYAFNGRGIVTMLRGNVDSIYPHALEAQQRRAAGMLSEAPFLSPAQVFASPVASDFLGAGDFDGDGHSDVVIASRAGQSLFLLSGDGQGGLSLTKEVGLRGALTAMTTGEINRADGLPDIVVGVNSADGSKIITFAGPDGAVRAVPEVITTSAGVTSLVLAQLDGEYPIDLAAAAGNDLLIVHGRDRKLSHDEVTRANAPAARLSVQRLATSIRSLAVGNFAGDPGAIDLATLGNDGSITILSRETGIDQEQDPGWEFRESTGVSAQRWLAASQLVSVRISSDSRDDLLLIDRDGGARVLDRRELTRNEGLPSTTEELNVPYSGVLELAGSEVAAVLPIQLNGDALNDLVMLARTRTAPVVLPTKPVSTIVVTNTNATGVGSLFSAILDANESPGADLITFNIPGGGTHTIIQTVQLPTITEAITVDGTSQPGFSGTPVIELSCSPNSSIDGLLIAAGSSRVRGLAINGFAVATLHFGLVLTSSGGNIVEGNFIGTDVTGTISKANSYGVTTQSANNTIGGTVAAARNLISGNGCQGSCEVAGLLISGAGGNQVQGNYIGTNFNGSAGLGNNVHGIQVYQSINNTIGGTAAGARNIISGNGNVARGAGILIAASPAAGTLVQGNFIGIDLTGAISLSNIRGGVRIENLAANNTIGGTTVSARNIISGNNTIGVALGGGGDLVQGNYLGTDVNGTTAVGNSEHGVIVQSANNAIGGTAAGAGNTISGNGLSGVLIDGATGNTVQGNLIGTDAAGTVALGNGLNGVTTSQSPNNTIGGATTSARNIISANGRHGVSIGIDTQSGSTGITVQNNYIGTDVTGNSCLGNFRDGVFVNRGSVSHTISDNLIACNGRNGVNIPNFSTNDAGIQIQVIQNAIYANAALGIDLGDPGATANDQLDADGGANLQQNFPVLTGISTPPITSRKPDERADRGAATVNINGTLSSTPNTVFTIHWYFSNDSQCSNNQLANRPLASGRVPGVTTGNDGNALFSIPLDIPPGVSNGVINSTATDPQGNTSEFSSCLPVSLPPSTTLKFSDADFPVNEPGVSATITITRSGDTSIASTVDYATSDGSATQNQDYVGTIGTLNFAPGQVSETFIVLIVDDALAEPNETINLKLNNAVGAALAAPSTATVTISANDASGSTTPAAKRFAAMLNGGQETPANNSAGKGTGYLLLNANETSAQVSLQFQNLGSAQTLAHIHNGAPGVAGPIVFLLPNGSPANTNISPTAQQVTDLKAGLHYLNVHSANFPNGEIRGQLSWNPTLEDSFFVRQQYLDFLSRDGDPGGFGFWVDQVSSCGADAECLHLRTISTSNAFFFEPEFQQTAGYVFRAYRAAFGNNQPFPNPDGSNATEANKLIDYAAFVADRARVVGGADLTAAQVAFANLFVARSAFTTKYAAASTAAQFVDAILANIQSADAVDLTSQRQALIDQYNNAGGGNAGRAQILYRLADDNAQNPITNQAFINAEYNRQFALTLYFGYLRRNPDIGGFLFWQSQINAAAIRDVAKQNALVCSFLTAAEYQFRFGPNAPRSNDECPH